MVLKYIIIASFGLTGTLFYLSKQNRRDQKALSVGIAEPETGPPKVASHRSQPDSIAGLQAVPAESPKYAALLPIGDQTQHATSQRRPLRDNFYEKYVYATVQSCFNELVKRRRMIYEEREGDAELSFDGELQIIATFTQNQVESLRSRSSEVRDDTFHNCIETSAKSWKFPEAIASQEQWSYKQRLSYDVNYHYGCKDSSLRLDSSEGSPLIGAGNCL